MGEAVTRPNSAKPKFIPALSQVYATLPLNVFCHTADVSSAEYFIADGNVRAAMVLTSAGTLLQT